MSAMNVHTIPSGLSGSNFSVTCNRTAGAAWPVNGFTVNVSVASGGCKGLFFTKVTTQPSSIAVTLAGAASIAVCPSDTSTRFNYKWASVPSGTALSLNSATTTTTGPNCSVTSTGASEWWFQPELHVAISSPERYTLSFACSRGTVWHCTHKSANCSRMQKIVALMHMRAVAFTCKAFCAHATPQCTQ